MEISRIGGIEENTQFSYSINPINNQYSTNLYTGSVILPDVFESTINTVWTGSNSIIRKYHNRVIPGTYTLAGSGMILASGSTATQFATQDNITITAHTGTTYVTTITDTQSGRTWNGAFIIGESMDTPEFLPSTATLSGSIPLSELDIHRIFRIGPDSIGMKMHLTDTVEINVGGV